ncbi:MAG: hypothetical protein PHO31_02510 [Candidatus Pacebacteria bacterium]|nr:hypothetical protein [Candidatus Paceibacterota bacterium]
MKTKYFLIYFFWILIALFFIFIEVGNPNKIFLNYYPSFIFLFLIFISQKMQNNFLYFLIVFISGFILDMFSPYFLFTPILFLFSWIFLKFRNYILENNLVLFLILVFISSFLFEFSLSFFTQIQNITSGFGYQLDIVLLLKQAFLNCIFGMILYFIFSKLPGNFFTKEDGIKI